MAVGNGLKGKLGEFQFFLSQIMNVSTLIRVKNKAEDYPLNKEINELGYYFSALMNSVQSIKDSAETSMDVKFSWSELSPSYGGLVRYCRNAITHDGSPIINGFQGGNHYIAGPLRRISNRGNVIEFDPPKDDIVTIVINFSSEFLLKLECLVSEYGKKIPSPNNDDLVQSLKEAKKLYFIPELAKDLMSKNMDKIVSSFDSHTIDTLKEINDQITSVRNFVDLHSKYAQQGQPEETTMEVSKNLEQELGIWGKAIGKATDSIYGVLISHLYMEHLLDRYLQKKLPNNGGLLGRTGLSFSNKLKLVVSLGDIDRQLADSLFKLNELRNSCVHIFGHEISDKDVERYGRTLGKDYKNIIKKYPDADTHGIAPITWNLCGRLLSLVASVEGWK